MEGPNLVEEWHKPQGMINYKQKRFKRPVYNFFMFYNNKNKKAAEVNFTT